MRADLQHHRIDLAAALRWAARLGLHEGVANHFSLTVPDEKCPGWLERHFAALKRMLDKEDPAYRVERLKTGGGKEKLMPQGSRWFVTGVSWQLCTQGCAT